MSELLNPLLNPSDVVRIIHEHFSKPDAVFGFVSNNNDDDYCVYRGNDDPSSPVRCAFGCVLPDDLYKPKMENKTASHVLGENGKISDLFNWNGFAWNEFLDVLQNIHDNNARAGSSISQFFDDLDEVENRWKNRENWS